MHMRTVEIDFDVHKKIEQARMSFGEDDNTVLRRLLGLKAASPKPAGDVKGTPWEDNGVLLPHGTKIRMEYTRVKHEGVISNGRWLVEGSLYDTPSGAATAIVTTKGGKSTKLNGWTYWQVKRPQDADWVSLMALRLEGQAKRHKDV